MSLTLSLNFLYLNYKKGQLLNADRKILTTNHSTNMTLKTNRELTNEIASPKKFNPDVLPKCVVHEQAKATKSISLNCNPTEKTNQFDFRDLKKQKKFTYEYHHWGGNNKFGDTINKRDKNPATLRLIEKRQELTKSGNLWFKFDRNLNREVSVPRRPGNRVRGEGSSTRPGTIFHK